MKKLLIIFCLVSGALFVHAEKSAFLGLSGGVSFDSNFLAKPAFSIGIGKELQNSQGTHLGVARLGLWNGEFELNYGYSFLRTGNWSLGIEGSALFGIDRVYSSERTNRYLALGGGIGLYARLKLSRYFDLGFQTGVRTIKGLAEESEWDSSEDIYGYAHAGLRYYF